MKTINILIRYTAVSLLFLQCTTAGFAQRSLEKAQMMKANYNYIAAIELYNDQFKNSQPTIEDARSLAECYMMINDTKSAEDWLANVVSFNDYNSDDVLHYADVLKSNGKYMEAIAKYKDYAALEPSEKAKTDQWISSCNMALEWIADPTYTDVVNAAKFNSDNSDFGLIPFSSGYILTSDRKIKGINYTANEIYGWTGNPYLKLYYTDGKDNSKVVPIDALNNEYHNGPATYNAEHKTLFFTRTKMVKIKRKPINSDPTSWYDHSIHGDYVNRLEIYFSSYANGQWQEAKPFAYNKPDEYSVGHPALSPDCNILYFVSDMPGGFGSTDIYYCEKQGDGSWSAPKNAGNIINSAGKEMFPYIDKDGTLYFSSDGFPGMGGLDIFSSHGSKDQWTTPENLKYPMNSPKDDFSIYFTESGQTGYFSSNRDGGKGEDDIYSFVPAPPASLIIVGLTRENLENHKLAVLDNVNIKVTNKANNAVGSLISDKDGKFEEKADCNATYLISATKDGFFATSKEVASKGCITRHDSLFVELDLDRIIINKPIVLQNIYYDFDKYYIRPDAAIELDKLVTILKDNPTINIELGSHTDSRGTDEYNQKLSQKRAESAVAYIISKGIDARRITAQGYGERVPVNKCVDGVPCTDEEYQLNRRTEFKVTSISK